MSNQPQGICVGLTGSADGLEGLGIMINLLMPVGSPAWACPWPNLRQWHLLAAFKNVPSHIHPALRASK